VTIYAPIIASLLFIGGVAALAVIGIINARFFAEVQKGRVARVHADAQAEALEASEEALAEIEHRRQENRRMGAAPVAEEPYEDMVRGILDERDYTTDGNEEAMAGEGPDGSDYSIPADRVFVEAEGRG
jgi:hypothetical protein